MNNIQRTFRSLFKSGQHNIIKIGSLSIGLTVGIILLAKVYFEKSYDQFYPEVDRVYQVHQGIIRDGEYNEYSQVAGGVVVRLKETIPAINAATRSTFLTSGKSTFTDHDKNKFEGEFILADSCFFDVLPRPMVIGNAKDVLSLPMHAIISRSLAEKMGGDVVGRVISLMDYPHSKQKITIGGVFEDLPENSSREYDAIVSMSSIKYFTWDGSMNMLGNDRYRGYIKLSKGTKIEQLNPGIEKMIQNHMPLEELEKAGIKFSFKCIPFTSMYEKTEAASKSTHFLMLLAIALIITAVLNYILIIISVLVNRAKEIAVYKCYGAGKKEIFKMALVESFVHFTLAILFGILLIILFQYVIYEVLNVSISALFLSNRIGLLMGVCCVTFIFVCIVSAYIYQQTPIASAFRGYKVNKRYWKLALLFFQFISVSFLLSSLVIVNSQYKLMVNDRPGYNYENIGHVAINRIDSISRGKMVEELKRLPEVESVASCSQLPFIHPSGNNVSIPGEEKELFNISDLNNAGDQFLSLLEIPIIKGRIFSPNSLGTTEIMIDRKFADKMQELNKWKDGAIGKNIQVTEHRKSFYTVCGIYENFRLSSIINQDTRPSVLFSTGGRVAPYLLIKLKDNNAKAIEAVENRLNQVVPNKYFKMTMWKNEIRDLYSASMRFRDSMLIGSIITLIISLIGLMGYTQDELNRRQKEIAIRKINGGSMKRIFNLFLKDILKIALPAITIGALGAFFASQYWLQQFSVKIELSLFIFLGCAFAALLIIILVMAQHFARVANANPVKALKCD